MKILTTKQHNGVTSIEIDGMWTPITLEIANSIYLDDINSESLATVYNSLHQFTSAGLLREVVVDSGRTYFDTNTTEHHHYFMEKEGCLKDIPAGEINFDLLPDVPTGKKFSRVEVIIHVADDV
ncbi:MAG: transcriptional repressor [Emcibacter sp.]|nr:transcriptional repressor [Emcibacter sp.]